MKLSPKDRKIDVNREEREREREIERERERESSEKPCTFQYDSIFEYLIDSMGFSRLAQCSLSCV